MIFFAAVLQWHVSSGARNGIEEWQRREIKRNDGKEIENKIG
jgi:hypothetical protein